MRLSRVGSWMIALGAGLGAIGGVALALGVTLSLSPEMQTVAFYKLLFISAATFLVGGAVVRRRLLRAEQQRAPATLLGERLPDIDAGLASRPASGVRVERDAHS